ncbi:branched-chain amino acid aminotransferase [Parvibaculum sedimenti]|uniref:Branched-chain-amino-acid aminotransferase n=1 Tax=Parvibaculum sedimenti TaxID=2608632 RepID=A0A6N6VJH0_9HYPH|nr:branched-chain amino acid aminotransferase [Parvibaculum sedimenti]KAB7739431.1 branched-chain amino acid aminotransferase [Parvibaculum sedimenti]
MADIPFDQRDGFIWFNGELIPWADAKIHLLTHGLHYASCVFEGCRAYNGEIFKLREHTERLVNSADILGFKIPYSVEEIDDACRAELKAQGLTDGYLRPVAWRGSEGLGVSAQKNKINLAVAAWEWPSYFDPEQRKRGIRLDMAKYRRPSPETAPSHAKASGLYMICTISKHAAEDKGYADAMMLDYRGYVAEATGANIFFVKDGVIHTPVADCFLNGITRKTVITLAEQRGFQLIERHILPEELSTFEECFIVGTAAEVTPVGEIGPHKYTPGAISAALYDDYMAEVRREIRVHASA